MEVEIGANFSIRSQLESLLIYSIGLISWNTFYLDLFEHKGFDWDLIKPTDSELKLCNF